MNKRNDQEEMKSRISELAIGNLPYFEGEKNIV
jgi:hypothetical protein